MKFGVSSFSVFVAILLLPINIGFADTGTILGERHAIELARYEYQIEGDALKAEKILESLLQSPTLGQLATEARAVLAEIYRSQGKTKLAISAYRLALADRNLSRSERTRLFRQLIGLDPGSTTAISKTNSATKSSFIVLPLSGRSAEAYVLEGTQPSGQGKSLAVQLEDGSLKTLPFTLANEATLLDAFGHSLLIYQPGQGITTRDFNGRVLRSEVLAEKPERGKILSTDGQSFMLLSNRQLNLFRFGQARNEFPVEGPCNYESHPLSPQNGVLLCGDQTLLQAEFAIGTLRTVSRLTEKPLHLQMETDHLLLQYADHIEIRRGPRFDAFSWGFPCQLQDRSSIVGNLVILLSPKGLIRTFNLQDGQATWQRDFGAFEIQPLRNGLLIQTFSHALIELDLKGNPLWRYDYGWGQEPLLLPTGHQIVIQYPNGKRMQIDRDIARAAGRPGERLMQDLVPRLSRLPPALGRMALSDLIDLEPGNGEAWKQRFTLDKLLGAPRDTLIRDLSEAARSSAVPAWEENPVLRSLAQQVGATWAFKREYGPKYYPPITSGKKLAFYLESDNQTLVILDPERGTLVNSFHFSEEIDLKASLWRGDTVIVSSPSRLYLISPWRNPGLLAQITLPSPLCQAISLSEGLLISDWEGHLRLIDPASGLRRLDIKPGKSGLLLSKGTGNHIDVVDLDGHYFQLDPSTSKTITHLDLPPGTPIELLSTPQRAVIALGQGQLIGIEREPLRIAWSRDFGEQIFSLSGNREEPMVITTASKRVITLKSTDGQILSDQRLSAYLFNRPLVMDDGFWIGTTEPALEKRSFRGEKLAIHRLTDLPGTPTWYKGTIILGTLDHLIFSFPMTGSLSRPLGNTSK